MDSVIPWSCQTNWAIAHGSLEASVTVESSDDLIAESDLENSSRKSPLILRPPVADSSPCEIKICFKQKYEVGQIYVRSTARAYEIYYAKSPHSINEYLCTVRCGVAERDDEVLQTICIEDVAEKHEECLSGEVTAETATDGENVVGGEDDWIKIKVPEVGRGSASDKISANRLNSIQDLYEATAQISDADPCSSLTVRLLSLQEKGHVCVDEIYVFVDPVESTDSGNEAVLAGSLAQSSLMAMFMPTLLQLSKSGVSRVQDKYSCDEVVKDGKMETESRITGKIDCHQPYKTPTELDKDTAESAEFQQNTSAKKCAEPININGSPPGHLEMTLEKIISRMSRLEDICLSFEEKMLKPIESMEARLQQVEHQLEKLAKNSQDVGLLHCTRISAPAFSCSESNSSSFNIDQSDYPPCRASELEKRDLSCDNKPEVSHDANFRPCLVVTAPEFSSGEGEENNDDLKPLKDSTRIKPKKPLSVDDALAAALSAYLSTAAINPSEHIQTTLDLSSKENRVNQYHRHEESCQVEAQEFLAADNGNRESLQYTQVLTVKAPHFTADETGNEEYLNYTQSSLDTGSATENDKKVHGDVMVPHSIQSNNLLTSPGSCDHGKNESTDDFVSASNGDFAAVSVKVNGMCPGDGHLNGSSELNMIDCYVLGDIVSGPAETSSDSALDLAKCSVETGGHGISDETNTIGKSTSFSQDDRDSASELDLQHEPESVCDILEQCERQFKGDTLIVSESSQDSLLDFEFPILEVKFTSDMCMTAKSPLEALLDGAAESNTEAPSVDATANDDGNTEQINVVITNGSETTDLLSIDSLLVDVGVDADDDSSNLEVISHNLCPTSSPEINSSLI